MEEMDGESSEPDPLSKSAWMSTGAGGVIYRIRAVLLCHDVRLNTHIQIEVSLDHFPTQSEAESLLWPEAERVVARNFCEGCNYEIYAVEVTVIES